jgi:hypothetical protein
MEVKEIKTVVNNLTDFIEVPNGIDKLRNAVLNLAVRGLLVEQRSSEGTADSDYKKIKTQAELDEISKSEEPFSIPENWRWVRLGQIVETKIGKTPPRKDSSFWIDAEIPWASIADLKQGNQHTIPFKVEGKCGSCKMILMPAPRGTGLVIEKECAKILKLAGIKDVYAKSFGKSKTRLNNLAACFDALQQLTKVKVRAEELERLGIIYGRIGQ